VFDFTDTYVRAVMVPRTDMVTVDASASTRAAMTIFLEKGVSRVPIVPIRGVRVRRCGAPDARRARGSQHPHRTHRLEPP